MRDGLEFHKKNKRIRIVKNPPGSGFSVQVGSRNLFAWICVASRGNIKEARIVADCFAALVEDAP